MEQIIANPVCNRFSGSLKSQFQLQFCFLGSHVKRNMDDVQIKNQLNQIWHDLNQNQTKKVEWQTQIFIPMRTREKNAKIMKISIAISNVLVLAAGFYSHQVASFKNDVVLGGVYLAMTALTIVAGTVLIYKYAVPRILQNEFRTEFYRLNFQKNRLEVLDLRKQVIKKQKIQSNTMLPEIPLPTTEIEHYRKIRQNIYNQLSGRLGIHFQAA